MVFFTKPSIRTVPTRPSNQKTLGNDGISSNCCSIIDLQDIYKTRIRYDLQKLYFYDH